MEPGRQWERVKWEVSAPSGNTASVALLLSYLESVGNTTSEIVTIPGMILAPTQYKLTLTVSNWFGLDSIFSVMTEVSSNTDTPTALILGAQPIRVAVMVCSMTCIRAVYFRSNAFFLVLSL